MSKRTVLLSSSSSAPFHWPSVRKFQVSLTNKRKQQLCSSQTLGHYFVSNQKGWECQSNFVRITMQLTVGSIAQHEVYPFHKTVAVSGGGIFFKLDVFHTYLQLQLDKPSPEFVTISTLDCGLHILLYLTLIWCLFTTLYLSVYHKDSAQNVAYGYCLH